MLYFISGTQTITKSTMEEHGLGYALDGPMSLPSRGVQSGPGGASGCLAGPCVDSVMVGYWPERQTWKRYPGKPDVWLGWDNDAKPSSASLGRKKMLSGKLVTLGDGHEWLIPKARSWGRTDEGGIRFTVSLPTPCVLNDSGEWVYGTVDERYKALWEGSCKVWDAFIGAKTEDDKPTAVSVPEAMDVACLAIGTNYRVSRVECAALGLMSDESMRDVTMALVDWDSLEELSGNG